MGVLFSSMRQWLRPLRLKLVMLRLPRWHELLLAVLTIGLWTSCTRWHLAIFLVLLLLALLTIGSWTRCARNLAIFLVLLPRQMLHPPGPILLLGLIRSNHGLTRLPAIIWIKHELIWRPCAYLKEWTRLLGSR